MSVCVSVSVFAHLSEGQVQDGLGGERLQVVLSGLVQGLQQERQRRGEA